MEDAAGSRTSGGARRHESTLAARTLFAGWLLITAVDAATALHSWLSLAFTIFETAAVLGAAALAVIRTRQHAGEGRDERRRGLRLALLWQVGIWLFIGASLWAQYTVLAEPLNGADAALLARSYRTYAGITALLVGLALLATPSRLSRAVAHLAARPAQLMATPFAIAACAGGLLLSLPISLRQLGDAQLLDAFFNAISAVCVTGLSPTNVATTYTRFGQGVLLVLLQIGGLGIAVLSAFFTVLAGRRMRARRAAAMAELLDVRSLARLRRMLVGVVLWTLVLEALGAALLYAAFAHYPQVALGPGQSEAALAGPGGRLWAAVFHSASAFCNAGFSLFQGGTGDFAHSPAVSLIWMGLIVAGGIGFPVIFELAGRVRTRFRRKRPERLSLHSRTVLATTAWLIGGGGLAMALLEWRGALAELSVPERILAALFQSVSCRTAGFATVDFGLMQPATLLVCCLLMFVGASPGSTGGGAKTATIAVLFATMRAELRRGQDVQLLGRAVSRDAVRKAIAVIFVSACLLMVALFAMLLLDDHAAMPLIFETVSAFSTTGLSTGITAELGAGAKVVLCFAMFIGRIGPLTIAAALTARGNDTRYRLVEERIGIG